MRAPVLQPAPPPARRACEILPEQWWDTDDDGNRLAIMLCNLCPGCTMNDPRPCGVIRAGVAYADDSKPRALCPCGYPAETPMPRGGRRQVQLCRRCKLPSIDRYRIAITRWHEAGVPWQQIAGRVHYDRTSVRDAYLRWTSEATA